MKKLLVIFLFAGFSIYAQSASVGNFILKKQAFANAYKIGEKNLVDFSVFDKNNQKVFTVHDTVDYDIPFPEAKIFRNGYLVVVHSFDASVDFYNNSGTQIKKVYLLGKGNIEYERAIYFDIGKNKVGFLLYMPSQKKAELFVYTINGNKLFSVETEGKIASGIAFDENGTRLAVSSYSWETTGKENFTQIYSSKGTELNSFDAVFTKGIFFDNREKFLGFTNKSIFVAGLIDNSLIWKRQISVKKIILDAYPYDGQIFIVDAAKVKLKKGTWRYYDLTLQKNDSNGKVIQSGKINTNDIQQIKFSVDKAKIKLKIDNNIFPIK